MWLFSNKKLIMFGFFGLIFKKTCWLYLYKTHEEKCPATRQSGGFSWPHRELCPSRDPAGRGNKQCIVRDPHKFWPGCIHSVTYGLMPQSFDTSHWHPLDIQRTTPQRKPPTTRPLTKSKARSTLLIWGWNFSKVI